MAFGLLYLAMTLIGKAGSNIKYGLDRMSAREQAKERGGDTYIDGRGITRTVNDNKAVSTYINNRGEALLLDKNNNIIKTYNKAKDNNYSIVTARMCFDKKGNHLFGDVPGRHKNFDINSFRYQDIKTGKYLGLRSIEIEDEWRKKGNTYQNISRTHLFYIDPITLKIVRESDGEIELRNRGFARAIDKNFIDNFILEYNRTLDNDYEPKDKGRRKNNDILSDMIDKMIWDQNHKKEV